MNPWEVEYAPDLDSRFAEQDKKLGLPAGTTKAQFKVESGLNAKARSKAGAEGWAQVMPSTRAVLEKRNGKQYDPANIDHALEMHEQLMRENMGRFGNVDDALRAYNGGWTPKKWSNPETAAYVPKIKANIEKVAAVADPKPWEVDYGSPKSDASGSTGLSDLVLGNKQKPQKPQVGTAGQVTLGAAKGIADLPQGLAYLVPWGIEKFFSAGGQVPTWESEVARKAKDYFSGVNEKIDSRYNETVGDSTPAMVSRVAANVVNPLNKFIGVGGGSTDALSSLWKTGLLGKAKSAAISGAQGAVQGAANDVHSNKDSVVNSVAGGAAGGVVGQAVVPAVSAGVGLLKSILRPFTNSGVDHYAGKALTQHAADPNSIQKAIAAPPSSIPGVSLTTAERASDPGLALLQRTLQSGSTDFATDMATRRGGNNQAMVAALRGIAGDDAAKAATTGAREAASSPLYSTAMDKVVPVDATLKDLLSRPSAEKAMARAIQMAKDEGVTISFGKDLPAKMVPSGILDASGKAIQTETKAQQAQVTGRGLHYLKMAMDSMIKDPSAGIAGKEREVVTGLKNQIVKAIEDRIPEYKNARVTYADLSKPVNQQAVAQEMIDRATRGYENPVTGARINRPVDLVNAVKEGDNIVKSATGGRVKGGVKDVMTPQQMQTLEEIKRIFNAENFADTAAGIKGSHTAQLGAAQDAISKIRQGVGFATMAGGPVSGLALQGVGSVLKGQDQKILARLADAMKDPVVAQQLMQQYGKGPTPQALAIRKAMQQALASTGAVTGGTAGQQ